MGLFIGTPDLTVGLVLPDARTYRSRSLVAFGVVAATALVVGLGGLCLAFFTVTRPLEPPNGYRTGVADMVAFDCVGAMHTFSYLGGLLGVLTASGYLLDQWARDRPSGNRGSAVRRGARFA